MISLETVKYSLKNLWQRKSRSFFTISSIFIGITTIFIFISFGWGLYDYINTISSGSSADKILIQAKGVGAIDTTFKLTDDDIKAIERTNGVFEATGAYLKPAQLEQGNIKKYTFLISYDPKKPIMLELNNIGVEKGRLLTSSDTGKVMMGYNYLVADKIFPKPYSVGGKITVQGKDLRIVGFLQSIGSPPDDAQIYVTNDIMKNELYPSEQLSYALIVARVDIKDIGGVVNRVTKNLRKERGLEEGKEDFFVSSFEDLIKTYMNALNIVIGFVVLIALISVLVSAVNTANTMITSVLERVKEIGIIKSVGARNSDIFKIFIFESSFLGFISGVIGVFLGWVITATGGKILADLGWGFLRPHYSFLLFFGLIFFATLTGGVSGFLPAYQASKLRPVESLRYE